MEIKDILELYQEKAYKYDLLKLKINRKIKKSERKLKNTNSNLKKIILETKIKFLKELDEV